MKYVEKWIGKLGMCFGSWLLGVWIGEGIGVCIMRDVKWMRGVRINEEYEDKFVVYVYV